MSAVYEYFLNSENFITGWTQWNEKNRSDLVKAPEPLKEMNTIFIDDLGRLYNDGYVFKMIDNAIVKEEYEYIEQFDKLIELEQRIEALEKK